ncbi:MAG: hypothetical protein ACSLFQ_01760 [Thermoanaerobaculia bacterium]
MPRRTISRAALAALAFTLFTTAVPAADLGDIRWTNDFRFYGDNTEFGGPYRDGETILGGQLLSFFEVPVGERITILAGGYADVRSGGDDDPNDSEPILSFRYRISDHSKFILGTLETERRHGLIDPIQVSTLELTRPVESGMQYLAEGDDWSVDGFINWQRENTPEHREAFDYGLVGAWELGAGFGLEGQIHGYHVGGQLYDAGEEVYNNVVFAPGASWTREFPVVGESRVRAMYLLSTTTEDDAYPERPTDGDGIWVELSVRPWERTRIFGILWQGEDFFAAEGDPNYGSPGTEPEYYEPDRDYKELGAEISFPIEEKLTFTAEARLHWIDDRSTEFSFRVYARVPIAWVVRKGRS